MPNPHHRSGQGSSARTSQSACSANGTRWWAWTASPPTTTAPPRSATSLLPSSAGLELHRGRPAKHGLDRFGFRFRRRVPRRGAARHPPSSDTAIEHYLENNVVATQRLLRSAPQPRARPVRQHRDVVDLRGGRPRAPRLRAAPDVALRRDQARRRAAGPGRRSARAAPACSLQAFSCTDRASVPTALPALIRSIAAAPLPSVMPAPSAPAQLHLRRRRHRRARRLPAARRPRCPAIVNIARHPKSTGDAIRIVEELMVAVRLREPRPRRTGDQQTPSPTSPKRGACSDTTARTTPENGLAATGRLVRAAGLVHKPSAFSRQLGTQVLVSGAPLPCARGIHGRAARLVLRKPHASRGRHTHLCRVPLESGTSFMQKPPMASRL